MSSEICVLRSLGGPFLRLGFGRLEGRSERGQCPLAADPGSAALAHVNVGCGA